MVEHLFKQTDLIPLERQPIEGNYSILVVGTFNGNIEGNAASWFYGRPENEFWCLFPRMMGHETLHPVDRNENIQDLAVIWKRFCQTNRVVIVDLFKDVLVDLSSHADKELENLRINQVTPFDFERAFRNAHFDKVMFTWKGEKENLLTDFKNRYIDFFIPKGSTVHHLLTPSNAYSKPRIFKLKQWREGYNHE
jgi:G:T/U-mismatch repair DNA glycosylase